MDLLIPPSLLLIDMRVEEIGEVKLCGHLQGAGKFRCCTLRERILGGP
jgi:hypothetical protein